MTVFMTVNSNYFFFVFHTYNFAFVVLACIQFCQLLSIVAAKKQLFYAVVIVITFD